MSLKHRYGLTREDAQYRDDYEYIHGTLDHDHCPPDEVIDARAELDRINKEAMMRNPYNRMTWEERHMSEERERTIEEELKNARRRELLNEDGSF